MRAAAEETVVIIPTYNEIDSLPNIVDRIEREIPGLDILVVDDSSPDGTADWVGRRGIADTRVHLLSRANKGGLAGAYLAGFDWALGRGYNFIIEMDADGSHPIESIPKMMAAVDAGADLVIGSRWMKGGSVRGWPIYRYLLSRLGNAYIRLILRLPTKDATAGFRLYRSTLLNRMDLTSIESIGYSFQTEMTLLAAKAAGNIVEIPIVFSEREKGHSKMSFAIMAESFARVTRWGLGGGPRK